LTISERAQLIAAEVGETVAAKGAAYGDAFSVSAQFLEMLFPYGVPVDRYSEVALLVRVFDKLKRIATANDPYGESPWLDVAGYALLGAAQDGKCKSKAADAAQRDAGCSFLSGRVR
jgi:hypothetical protein